MSGWVYVIAGGNNLYKIGSTNRPISERLQALQTGSSTRLKVELTIWTDAPASSERMLHKKFAHLRQHGEWFLLSKTDLKELREISEPPTINGRPTWTALVILEPRLDWVLRAAKSKRGKPGFCANEVWYLSKTPHLGLRGRMRKMVGHLRMKDRNPALITSAAYDVAYQTIYQALPDCRHEIGLCK